MHLTLHPADSRAVLEAGWGERHPLSRGGAFERFVPENFVMVYAPRDEEEIEMVVRLILAARWFVSGKAGVAEEFSERRDSAFAGEEDGNHAKDETCDSILRDGR